MADFDTCYPFLLSNEDYNPPRYETVPDPVRGVDPNAQAISGINSHYWPIEFSTLNSLDPVFRADGIKNFYEENFWTPWLAQLNSNRIAAMILDSSVNQGEGVAVKLAQIAAGLSINSQDGKFGPLTLAAINGASEGIWVTSFVQARVAKYQSQGNDALVPRAQRIPDFE